MANKKSASIYDLTPEEVEAVKGSPSGSIYDLTPDEIEEAKLIPNSSFGEKVANGLLTGARAVDSVSGAPTRAAIYAAQEGKNPINAFTNQFANMTDEPPSGADIAKRAGVSDSPIWPEGKDKVNARSPLAYMLTRVSKADLAGFPIEMGADYTMLAKPAAQIMRGAGKAVSKMAGTATKPLQESLATGIGKVGEAFTGVPEKATTRYILDKDGVKRVITHGGGSIAESSDVLKDNFGKAINSAIQKYGADVEKALTGANPKAKVSIDNIIDYLEIRKNKITPNLDLGARDQIDEIIKNIKSGTIPGANIPLVPPGKKTPPGQLSLPTSTQQYMASPQYLNDVKVYLQTVGKRAYSKSGQMFANAPQALQAAKGAASQARIQLNKVVPGVEFPNNQLHKLHILEDTMNKRMIAPGQSEASLITAGTGENARNRKALSMLEDITKQGGSNVDMVADAERLAAAKYFNEPKALPIDSTGKSSLRSMLAKGSVGFLLAHLFDFDPKTAALIGASFSSPMALKAVIDTGRFPLTLVNKLGVGVKKVADISPTDYARIISISKTPQGARIIADFYNKQEEETKKLTGPGTPDDAFKRRLSKPKE